MKIYLKFILVLFTFACIKSQLNAQTVDDYLKNSSAKSTITIQKYFLNSNELKSLSQKEVDYITNDRKKELGIEEYQSTNYRPKNDDYGEILELEIILCANKEKLNSILALFEEKEIFEARRTHIFLVDEKTLVKFYLKFYTASDKNDSKRHLELLNSYRQRLNAQLLIPPSYGNMTETEYFIHWANWIKGGW